MIIRGSLLCTEVGIRGRLERMEKVIAGRLGMDWRLEMVKRGRLVGGGDGNKIKF